MNTHGPVEPDKDNIRQEPYTLPQGFTWDALDLGDRGVVSTSSLAHTLGWRLHCLLAVPCLDCQRCFWERERVLTTPGNSPAQWSHHLLGLRWV